jgi:hypothetical protein
MELSTEGGSLRAGSHLSSGIVEGAYKSQPWYEAYMAALFESDRGKIGESIRRAELMIVRRERELFTGPLDPKEQRALNNALHALRALQGCLKL